ncbi:MAG: glycosyl hydrolase, partial [Clostridiales bacterium]|nr:glycosyl hydrolase [Clostridiales bacterium]
VGIEEEGGFNSYLNGIGVTGYYDQMGVYGDGYETDRVYEIGNEIGTAITGIGFNIDLAPVADTLNNVFNTEVGRRAFSTNPETTAVLVTQMVKGLHSGGCMSCLKYFPGLSVSNMDSRYGTAVSEQTLEQLQGNLLPFSTGIENGADMIMVSHLCFPNIVGENRPADLCPEIVNDLLRVQLGYDGVVMTDSFQKGAISYLYDTGDAAVAAIQAGCDMIYQPDDLTDAAQAILDAVNNGRLTEERINESVLRILALKYANGLK